MQCNIRLPLCVFRSVVRCSDFLIPSLQSIQGNLRIFLNYIHPLSLSFVRGLNVVVLRGFGRVEYESKECFYKLKGENITRSNLMGANIGWLFLQDFEFLNCIEDGKIA